MPKWGGLSRRCHWLSRNKRGTRPEALLFLDCEADIITRSENVQEHEFKLAVAVLCIYSPENGLQERSWKTFHVSRDLWEWIDLLCTEYPKLVVVAHNVDYDARLSCAFSHLPQLEWSPSFCVMARSCTMFVWEKGEAKLTLLDNMNLWKASLAQLGESVGLPKLEVDFDQANDEDLERYCKRDVEILVKLWQEWLAFLDEHDLGSWGITVAKQAFNAYRHRFMPCKIGIHDGLLAVQLERAAYRGGRSECFFVGKAPPGNYYKVDVNALYAAMMSWYPMPRALVKVVQNITPDYLNHLMKDYLAIAEVVLDAKNPMYCKKIGGRNLYPTGTFTTTLTTPELETALVNDEVRGIGLVALYRGANLFEEYVDFWTPLRQEYQEAGNTARANMCKLLRNSLQGKFGQRGHKQEIIGEAPLDKVAVRKWVDVETGRRCEDWTFGGRVIRSYQEGESFDSFPAIPAHVAAYGRLYMWSLIRLAGKEHVFYIDTDSLILDQTGFDNLAGMIDSAEIGFLKLEGMAQDLEIFAKKDYVFADRRTVKGIKEDALQLAPNVFEQWQFTTARYGLTSHNLDGVKVYRVKKKLRYNWLAGTISADGRVHPAHLHVDPKDLVRHMRNYHQGASWIWEFNPVWLDSVENQAREEKVEEFDLAFLPQVVDPPRPLQFVAVPFSTA